ncbi:molybdenum cofactor guanylyltransferase [Microbacterium sp. P04]|uniref:molybdenum cofactor guanylyltransferase n=1 Tax=Microbacterium sp. P04 TaxID=3366947 RepID=UPI003747121F
MLFDAIVLSGGRSTRLGQDKARLMRDGRSLLAATVAAVRERGARRILVMGGPLTGLGDGVAFEREDPPFSGPAAAVAAGIQRLGADSPFALVVACDMPMLGDALDALVGEASREPDPRDGFIGVDADGRRQQLLLLARTGALSEAVERAGGSTGLIDASMRTLLAPLDLVGVPLPEGSADDIDTTDDAVRFGYAPERKGSTP